MTANKTLETITRHLKGLIKCCQNGGDKYLPDIVTLDDLESWLNELEQEK